MKALSIRQPWATAIIHFGKDIENRTWKTNVRGRVLIHAGQAFDDEGWLWIRRTCQLWPEKHMFLRGGIIGEVEIIDCCVASVSPWFFGPYGFVLRNAKPRPFRRCQGRLGFFEIPDQEDSNQ